MGHTFGDRLGDVARFIRTEPVPSRPSRSARAGCVTGTDPLVDGGAVAGPRTLTPTG